MTTRIQLRRATAAAWSAANPVLALGEMGIETDTYKIKVGDGVTLWNGLAYFAHSWADVTGKPTVIASGATQAAARSAISAASLDANGKIPVSELPASLMAYQGVWNAQTNSPTLVNGTGDIGDVYRVTVGGTRNLGTGNITFDVGDYVILNTNLVWEKSDTTDAVSSVAGRTGDVTLSIGDVSGSATAEFTLGQLHIGHATDTTLSRISAGVLGVEGVAVPTTSSVSTLTNKRITPRVTSITSSATPTIESDSFDQFNVTALAVAITGWTITGTPSDGQKLLIRIKDNGTARGITWGASTFVASGAASMPTTTAAGKTHLIGFIYDSVAARWVCVAADASGY